MALLEIETIAMCQTIFLYNQCKKINIFDYNVLLIKHEYSFLFVLNSLYIDLSNQNRNRFKRIV